MLLTQGAQGMTITAAVVIFAVAALVDAAVQAARAFSSDRAGPVLGHLLLACSMAPRPWSPTCAFAPATTGPGDAFLATLASD